MLKYEVSITPITPLHIGTGEELMPFSYTIMDIYHSNKEEKFRYVRFSDEQVVRYFTPEQLKELQQYIDRDDFPHLRQRYNQFASEIIPAHQKECIYYLADITDEIRNLWCALEEKPQNSFIIQPTICSLYAKKPYIPGSSLKGAIRTALLDPYAQDYANENPLVREQDMLAALEHMEDHGRQKYKAQDDPLRVLKVTDAFFPAKGMRLIGQLVLYNREKQQPESIAINEEVLKCLAISNASEKENAESFTATTTLALDTKLHERRNFMLAPRSFQEIADRCNTFYKSSFDEEYERFYCDGPDELFEGYKVVNEAFDHLEPTKEFMIRLGRHSQIEYLTFSTERRPGGKAFNRKTRTVFKYRNKLLPMGWVRCRLIDQAEV